jgi:small-conductance mechanosensitive channel
VIFSGATIALILLAYRWYQGVTSHRYLLAFVAAVAVVAIVFLIPGLTLAQLVSRRERRWRRDLEQTLLEKRSEGGTRT